MKGVLTGIVGLVLSGCVSHLPLEAQSPDLSFLDEDTIVISVIDERSNNRDIAPDVIGKAHGVFGIPSKMKTFPWFESDKENKDITLREALEDRIVFGLNDEGWKTLPAGLNQQPTRDEIIELLDGANAENLLLLVLNDWYVSINLNWVTAFNFDWGVTVNVFDDKANLLFSETSSGRDVVDAQASQSWPNMIRLAYRDRLVKILEEQSIEDALAGRLPAALDEGVVQRLEALKAEGKLTEDEYEILMNKEISNETLL